MHGDEDSDDNLDDEAELGEAELDELDELDEADSNAHVLSIRAADGRELVTIFSPNEEWTVHLQPGGGVPNAFLGARHDPVVWVDAIDRQIERDEDGTYVIRVD